ncbi:hypothetical protein SAMN04488109_6724 [Chryseolinea serpens]|uniref:Uncharacterized protein n=1 Tax=Chryseolinea serpens TaxID=947013 RepID=A0A1M5XNI3_9BACT|nr:hypothetical protein [Chryseolinea serpens]SHI00793.1 hypothetical protein SAMN04488109_6724 [Chryseolinea serpens]
MKNITLYALLFIALMRCGKDEDPVPENPADTPYDVAIDPNDFETTSIVGNEFFPLIPEKTYVYEGKSDEGGDTRILVAYTSKTKMIQGVTCVEVHDQAYENGSLVEDTYDWYAQDKQGNVWYFGEATQTFENGQVTGTKGSWEAGVNGAMPGIIMLAKPLVSMWYRQEYFKGEAEDVAQVLSSAASVSVPYGSFENCLQTAEWSLLETGIVGQKYYAPGVGVVKSIGVKGESGYEDLKEIQ